MPTVTVSAAGETTTVNYSTAVAPYTVVGSNIGGYFSTLNEQPGPAHARIKAAFGGRLPAIRVWSPYDGSINSTTVDPTCQVYVCEIGYGLNAAALDGVFARVPQNAVVVPVHEVDNPSKGISPAQFQTYVTQVGAAHVRSGRTDVKVALMLMGQTYDPARAYSYGPWTKWIPNPLPPGVDAIGGDIYPWGKSEGSADTAAYQMGKAKAAATTMGVPYYIGELGCGAKYWSDAKRAQYTRDALTIITNDPLTYPVVCVYEADNGNDSPWCVTAKPDGTGGWPLTVAVITEFIQAVPVKGT